MDGARARYPLVQGTAPIVGAKLLIPIQHNDSSKKPLSTLRPL